jgi:hypothetical protein
MEAERSAGGLMTRERVIDKVNKLLALASSPEMEEARSAAHMAAQLIRDNQLQIIDPTERHPAQQETWGGSWGKRDPHDGFVITSKYPGRCKGCHRAYDEGDRIFWKKGVGSWHEACKFERPF